MHTQTPVHRPTHQPTHHPTAAPTPYRHVIVESGSHGEFEDKVQTDEDGRLTTVGEEGEQLIWDGPSGQWLPADEGEEKSLLERVALKEALENKEEEKENADEQGQSSLKSASEHARVRHRRSVVSGAAGSTLPSA